MTTSTLLLPLTTRCILESAASNGNGDGGRVGVGVGALALALTLASPGSDSDMPKLVERDRKRTADGNVKIYRVYVTGSYHLPVSSRPVS
jgi:hypothetical protein